MFANYIKLQDLGSTCHWRVRSGRTSPALVTSTSCTEKKGLILHIKDFMQPSYGTGRICSRDGVHQW